MRKMPAADAGGAASAAPSAAPMNGAVQGVATSVARSPVKNEPTAPPRAAGARSKGGDARRGRRRGRHRGAPRHADRERAVRDRDKLRGAVLDGVWVEREERSGVETPRRRSQRRDGRGEHNFLAGDGEPRL